MSDAVWIAGSLAFPSLGALVIASLGHRPNVRDWVLVVAAALTLGCVVPLVPAVFAGGNPAWSLFEMVGGVDLAFRVEPLGMVFGLVAGGLFLPTSVYAIGYMRGHHEDNQTRFFVCFAFAISAALGIAFAANLLTLFLFYELLTLSTYPLVTHHQTDEARRAGRVYLGFLLTTSVCFLLLAVLWTYDLAGTLEFLPGGILSGSSTTDPPSDGVLAVLLALFVFGTGKAAVMPFHRWLPAAMVAPAPVSALLHAVAVVKAGVFTVLKIAIYVFGLDSLAVAGGAWLPWVASATILIASVVALTRGNLKARLAYSTVSQLSYIVLAAGLASSSALLGGAMHIAMHAVAKITLFFCAGAIAVAAHKTEVRELDGLGRRMPITFGAFGLASLAIIGLPPLGGAWSKWYLIVGALEADGAVFAVVLMLSSLLSVAYLMPIVGRAFFLPPAPEKGAGQGTEDGGGGIREAPLLCVIPLCITALGCVVLFFFAEELALLLAPIVGGGGGAAG